MVDIFDISNLLAARLQMAISLGFHIIFAVIGIAMPLMMVLAEWQWLRTKHPMYRVLAQRWAKGTAILFAVGAVSGTVLSFELGLLWPSFMAWSGSLIGPLFALEGFAFFTEAIFLGIYLYGWDRISPRMHIFSGVIVVVSGVASAIFVVLVNGWMNSPTGFDLQHGQPVNVDPLGAMANPMGLPEVHHMILAAFAATGFIVAGIHAWSLLRDPRNLFHQGALGIAFLVGSVGAILQPISGDLLSKAVEKYNPIKLAAFEAHFHTTSGAAFHLGGIPDEATGTVNYSLEIPYGLSLLLYGDPYATVQGLDAFPRDEWPPVAVVHIAFQIMVGIGFVLAGISVWGWWLLWRGEGIWNSRLFLRALVLVAPLGMVAIEAGWIVTEVGRQPWIIMGIMRTAEAVTPMPGLLIPLIVYTGVYLVLAAIVVWLLIRHIGASPRTGEYGEPRIKESHASS
jgi:cytochrome bd ubiquinol oxidase subunit I